MNKFTSLFYRRVKPKNHASFFACLDETPKCLRNLKNHSTNDFATIYPKSFGKKQPWKISSDISTKFSELGIAFPSFP